jgi:hypothetical protein
MELGFSGEVGIGLVLKKKKGIEHLKVRKYEKKQNVLSSSVRRAPRGIDLEIGTKLSKSGDFTVLGEVQFERTSRLLRTKM